MRRVLLWLLGLVVLLALLLLAGAFALQADADLGPVGNMLMPIAVAAVAWALATLVLRGVRRRKR